MTALLQGGGSIAAQTIGLAAELVAMVARDDARAWQAAADRLGPAVEGGDRSRDAELRSLLASSAELPVVIAETGADVAVLAERDGDECSRLAAGAERRAGEAAAEALAAAS